MPSSASEAIVKVEKATNHLLIGADWTMNMEICDSVNSNQWPAKDVVKAVKKRIQHKKPRVQFLALTLLETMMKNCGDFVHFQVIDREILQEMIKIVRKRTDMQVRDKILALLDSWQEAFGGPHGKYPQYYWAYAELKKSGVHFPKHSVDAAPIFTPPVTHPVPGYPPAGYGMPTDSSLRFEEATMSSSDMGDLRLSDLDSIRRVTELLDDMLQAVNSNDREAVKDEVIVDLVNQCRTNQKKIIHWVSSSRDEEVLAEALELNDNLQYLIAKHDAIASGSQPPIKASEPTPSSDNAPPALEPQKSKQVEEDREEEEEEEEEEEDDDDGFAQLARRKSKINTDPYMVGSSPGSDVTTATTSTSKTEASSSTSSNALVLSDYPDQVNTTAKSKDQDMIDLLSLTLTTTDPSPSPTQVQDHPQNPQQPQIPQQQYPAPNQGYAPYANNYVAPWAQPALPQPQYPQYTTYSTYPPPPWATPSSVAVVPPMHAPRPLIRYNTFSTEANSGLASRQLQHQSSLGSRGNTSQGRVIGAAPAATGTPYIPSYRLFEDLIDLDGGVSTKNTDSSAQKSMLTGGRK